MGCRESSKVTKTARLLAPTHERATCSPTEPGLDPCPQPPRPGARPLHSQPHHPKVGSLPRGGLPARSLPASSLARRGNTA